MSGRLSGLSTPRHIFRQVLTRFDPKCGAMWYYMDAKPRPCVTFELLEEIGSCQRIIEQLNRSAIEQGGELPIPFVVVASRWPGIYNLGGDLHLFRKLILARDRAELRRYARACIGMVHSLSRNCELPITTIALVQGDALGGGFEAALACSVLVAEKRARFGLPEILFNLFPGMGAYSLLARRLDPARAERIIKSGAVHTATELHEMGIVDVLAEDGDGENAVCECIANYTRRRNAHQSLFRVRQRLQPIPYEELADISEVWVDAALSLGPRDIRVLERLLKAQDRISGESPAREGVEAGRP